MPSVFGNIAAVCAAVASAFFALQKICVLHAAYELRRTRIEKETWLRAQCARPEFYTNMRYHTNLCEEVEATARIGAAWHALTEVAGSLPIPDLLQALHRLGWPLAAALALAFLLFPSAVIAQMRQRQERLPRYQCVDARVPCQ
jgi:hypothetical protein